MTDYTTSLTDVVENSQGIPGDVNPRNLEAEARSEAAASLAQTRADDAAAARTSAQAALTGAETALSGARVAQTAAQAQAGLAAEQAALSTTARGGSEAAADKALNARLAAENASVLSADARSQSQQFAAASAAAAATAAARAGQFATVPDLIAIAPPTVITAAEVTADPDPTKNGTYMFNPALPNAGVSGWVWKSAATTPATAARVAVVETRFDSVESQSLATLLTEDDSILMDFDRDGVASVEGIRCFAGGFEGAVFPVVSNDGDEILFGIDRAKGFAVFDTDPDGPLPREADESKSYAWAVTDEDGRAAILVDNAGQTTIDPSDDTIGNIAGRLPSSGSSAAAVGPEAVAEATGFTEIYGATQLSATALRYLALDTASGATSLRGFHSRLDLLSSTAIREAPGPIIFLIHEGDSTSVGGSKVPEDPLVHPIAPLPRDALMFNVGARPGVGVYTLNPSDVTDLVPLRESAYTIPGNATGYGETVGSGCAVMMAELLGKAGKRRRTSCYATFGQAGYEIGEIGPGTKPFENVKTAIGCCIRLARIYGRRPEFVFLATIGVNDRSQRDASYIQARITALQAANQAEVVKQMTEAGLAAPSVVRMIVSQMAAPSDNLPVFTFNQMDVAAGQLAAVEASNGAISIHTGRAYLRDTYGIRDTLHPWQLGYAVEAEYFAKAILWEVLTGTAWTGCRPQAVTRTGATVVIDCYGVGDLVQDTTYWPASPADGFSAGDDSGPIAITSVAKTGPRQITVTLAAVPTGPNPFVAYAYATGAGASGRPGTWGNWRDSDPTESKSVPGLLLRNPLTTFKRAI